MAITRQPAARKIWIARTPTRPTPITATVSPKVTFAWRTPCMAIAPIVVKRRSLQAHICGNENGKICGHKIDLAVAGVAYACASDAVARLKTGHAGARLQHKTRAGVAQRRRASPAAPVLSAGRPQCHSIARTRAPASPDQGEPSLSRAGIFGQPPPLPSPCPS